MSLYDRCVDLQLKLEVAQSADAGVEVLARGGRLVEELDRAAEYLEGAAQFRSTANLSDTPSLDVKAVTQAVAGFRGGLSRRGSAAFQHQPATTLVDVAKAQRDRTVRWVNTRWKDVFVADEALLERVQNEHFVGSGPQLVVAKARAAKLRAVRGRDPVADFDDLCTMLGGDGITEWFESIANVRAELQSAVVALDDEREALTPEVREALQRAGTDDGLPLSEVTPELLSTLHAAGVDDHLVVRRS